MSTALRPLRALAFALLLSSLGCHAQAPADAPGKPLSPELARRIEVLLRSSADLPPEAEIVVGERKPSELAGYDEVPVRFIVEGQTSPPTYFMLSSDNKTLAQFKKYDISQDPKLKVSGADRPGRGGPEQAPVLIVIFDDLQCPFCARMQSQLFPALLQRYGDSVHVVYRDFPLESIHPWALRAAVDVNCMAAQSTPGYWDLVDSIHAHSAELWNGDPKTLAKTNDDLDRMTREEGTKQKVDAARLDTCVTKQDATAVEASRKAAETMGLIATPVLYINGAKIEGAVSPQFIYKIIDNALVAAGKTPPPPLPVAAPPPATAANTNPGH